MATDCENRVEYILLSTKTYSEQKIRAQIHQLNAVDIYRIAIYLADYSVTYAERVEGTRQSLESTLKFVNY